MPTVPVIQDSAQLQVGEGRRRVQGSPDAFGALEAQGAQKLSRGVDAIAQVAAEKDDEFDDADATAGDTEIMAGIRGILHDPQTGYLTSERGRRRNAMENRDQVNLEIDEVVGRVVASRRSPRAQQRLLAVAQRRALDALGDVADHEARELRTYHNEVSEARLSGFMDNAVAAYADPAAVAAQIDGGVSEIQRMGEREQWAASVVAQRVRQFHSQVSAQVIGHLATTDPDAAEEMFELVRPTLTAQEAGELRTTMQAAQRTQIDRVEGMAWQAYASGRSLQSLDPEAYRELTTNPLLGNSHARVTNAYRTRAQSYARGETARANSPAMITARMWSARNPREFIADGNLESFIAEHGHEMTNGDISQILTSRETMRSNGTDPAQHANTFRAVRAVATPYMRSMGMELEPNSARVRGDDDRREAALRADAFDAALLESIQEFMGTNGAAPRGAEVQELIGRAVVRMDTEDFRELPDFLVRGRRGRAAPRREIDGVATGSAVAPPTRGVVIPFSQIPPADRDELTNSLRPRLGRMPTRGEVENAYARFLADEPFRLNGGSVSAR